MSSAIPDVPLNEPQRRHFEVLLSMLEDSLHQVEALSEAGSESAALLTVYADDLPPGFAAQATPRIAELRARIAQLTAELDIAPRVLSRRRAIRALVLAQTVRLEDSYARTLRGYGAVDPRLAALVDPVLDAMHAALVALGRSLDAPPTSPAPGPGPR